MAASGGDVVVIGGGATGLSAAWWLAREGVRVVVLERGLVGWEASGRNGGGCTHPFSPLFREEQHLWPQMDDLLGHPTEWRPNRIVMADSESELANLEADCRAAARDGFHAEMISSKQLHELVPIAGPAKAGGAFWHFGGHANPQRTVQAYAWAIQALGGRIVQHTEVTGFELSGGRVTAVVSTAGTFGCDAVVVAAGPKTGVLAGWLGAHLPVTPARAEIIVTEALPLMAHGGINSVDLYGRQTLRGNLVYGGGPHEWLPPADPGRDRPTTPLVRNLAKRLARMFPGAAHARVLRHWAGVIENTPDGRPVIERLREPDNAVVATMSSVGFGLSPATGHAICDLVLRGRCDFADLRSLRLSRFANLPADWRERRGWVPPDGTGTA
jgi:sarcosine oxidase subunit beta